MPADVIDWSTWEPRFEEFLARGAAPPDPAHDLLHVTRVVALARALAAAEGARLEIVAPAAWLHDCVAVPKDAPARRDASRIAAGVAERFLRGAGYPERFLPAIAHAIAAHSFSGGIAPRTIEARVVRDADRLDALGAIGIARCLMLGGALGKPLYDPREPFPVARPPDDTANVLDHFSRKLLRLADTMQTAAGRVEAEARTAFMRQFLAQLGRELGPPDAPNDA
jgi:uncharacterized protein